jgi:hypothetical protein
MKDRHTPSIMKNSAMYTEKEQTYIPQRTLKMAQSINLIDIQLEGHSLPLSFFSHFLSAKKHARSPCLGWRVYYCHGSLSIA